MWQGQPERGVRSSFERELQSSRATPTGSADPGAGRATNAGSRRTMQFGNLRPGIFSDGYGAIQATFRAGANPTGTRATSFMEAISTTETLFVCELAT